MWLVIGLGNPGEDYVDTRHNVGFMVIDALASEVAIPVKHKTINYIYGRGFIEEYEIVLIKPLTFMNRSGAAVKEALRRYEEINNIVVIHDDLDLDTGIIRIRKTGSSGGHNGVQSIIDYLGTKDFIRIKIGIGRSERISPEKYVLRAFSKREKPVIEEAVKKAAEAVQIIVTKGIAHAQNIFHKK
jgi:PTH1 family peptidyl-tRNA hydrolase